MSDSEFSQAVNAERLRLWAFIKPRIVGGIPTKHDIRIIDGEVANRLGRTREEVKAIESPLPRPVG